MAKKQGKVRAIPVTEVIEGMQVLLNGYIYFIRSIHLDSVILVGNPKLKISISEFKTLVVEYEEGSCSCRGLSFVCECGGKKVKQLPLKYSQWQSAINNNEVDTDKVVEFETVNLSDRSINIPQGMQVKTPVFAKIIPQKKRMYGEEEVEKLLKEFYAVFAAFPTMNLDLRDKWIEDNLK